ncbi:beta strand repeat-containing protein [Winogradskyella sp. Asnod2-B02-A]|uniref:beta strand repeat-containing protein n=1 Tax=Winogradskyella sp. Asnod2-B02-A TaxID=3160583 RepID=UPI0038651DA5
MKKLYTFLFALMLTNLGFAQTTIYTQDFEADISGYSHTPSQTPSTDPGDQYFNRAEPSNSDIYESGGPYTNVTGSWLFVGSNPKTINSGISGVINFGSINVSGYSDLIFSADFGGVPNDWDATDELSVEYSWDNTNWNVLYSFSSPVTNDPLELENNATGGANTSNGTVLNYALQTISSNNFTGTGTTLYLRIVCNSNANYEAFGVDNIVLQGTAISTCTAPTSEATVFSESSVTSNSATLSWARGNGDNVIVVMKEGAAVDFTPTSGTGYTANAAFAAGTEVGTGNYLVYNGSDTSIAVTGLTQNETYHVAVYEYNDTDTCYMSTALTGNFTTLASTTVEFTGSTASVSEDVGTYDLEFTIANEDAINDTTFDVVLVTGDATDIDTYTTQTVTFLSGTNANQTISITITDDIIAETDETLTFQIQNVAGGNAATIGSNDIFDLTILSSDIIVPSLIITEVADPGDDFSGRFVEIYNNGTTSIDLSTEQIYFVRQANGGNISSRALTGTLSANCILVIGNSANINSAYGYDADEDFGDVTGNGDDGYFLYYGGDEISGTLLDAYGELGQDGTGEAWEYTDSRAIRNNPKTTSPNATWTASEWTISSADVADMTPGSLENEYRYGDAWKPSDPNGVSTISDDIIIVSGDAAISVNTNSNNVYVKPGANLTINTGVSLTVNGTEGMTLNSTSTSYSSLILDGTIAGTVTYNRYVNSNNSVNGNDLISAPLSGQAFDTFIANNPNIRANPSGPEVLFGGFDNNSSTDPFELWNDTDTTPLTAGKGYRSGITEGEASNLVTFEGTVNTSLVQVTIAQGTVSKLNLIGNPFPSYLDAQQFLSHNASLLDPSAVVIYGYNDSTDGTSAGDYTIISALLNTSMNIAPGQGFFIASGDTGGDIEFTTTSSDMRLATGGDDFIAGRDSAVISNLKLNLSNANANFITDIFFTQNSTLGLDPGYDASLLGGAAPSFALYSELIEDNTGIPFAVQALGKTDYLDVTIPLGVNANQSEQLTFSISETNLPSTIDVYLDDTIENTSTLLNNGDYVITPNVNLSGTGRFYLRLSESTLSTIDHSLEDITIYTNSNEKTAIIAGQLLENTTAYIYDIQGRAVSTTLLDSTSRLQSIDTSNLTAGIYVVQLINGTQNKTQKVIIH